MKEFYFVWNHCPVVGLAAFIPKNVVLKPKHKTKPTCAIEEIKNPNKIETRAGANEAKQIIFNASK